MTKKYANIIIDIAHESVDRTFQYKIPQELQERIRVGQEVYVPFGKGDKSRKGYVIELTDRAEYDVDKLKELQGISSKTMAAEGQMIELAGWIRETYGSTMIQALKTVLPVKDKIQQLTRQYVCLSENPDMVAVVLSECRRKKHQAKVRLLEWLTEHPVTDMKTVREQLKVASSTVQSLAAEGVVTTRTNLIYRNPVEEAGKTEEYTLTPLQQSVVRTIDGVFEQDEKKPFLLHGITGSGKTEVYVELVSRAAAKGKPSIVLIPEIALTKQTVMRFYKRFGDRVSIIHSRLSKGERYDQFQRAKNGEIDVMIGPRSALFTPFSNLGYIIIDEEHETSYKSDAVPKYHARETAIKRAQMTGATVVLASATPSVDSYYRALHGQYQLVEMKERISRSGLAEASIVDMRTELMEGNRSIFSRQLAQEIQQRLDRKQQVLLFLNRRGYHGFISCRACGEAVKCPNCDVTLSSHNNGRMMCHYCGYEQKKVDRCPSCGSKYIGGFRVGTEQVEELVQNTFPVARVLRMDMDTTKGKHGHEQIVTAFSNQEADILIGTQMIVKGHDFPNVTLVGILAADMSLQASDYKSSERTFQLLTQAAGRAGRGDEAGQVVIQTYNPQHYSIRLAKEQDYGAFYQEEMQFRQMMSYPPAGNVMEIFLSADSETVAEKEIQRIFKGLDYYKKNYVDHEQNVYFQGIGPAPAPIAKLNNRYRQVIYVKSNDKMLLQHCRMWLEESYVPPEGVQLMYDMNL